MKTWEMIKELTENPSKIFKALGNEHLRVWVDGSTITFLNTSQSCDYYPSTKWEWEEVKEPVTFIEVLEQVKNDNLMIVSFKHKELTFDYARCTLDYVLSNLSKFYESDVIARLLLEGKWYIED